MALGAEQTEFVGISSNGKYSTIKFINDYKPNNQESWRYAIYGSRKDANFKYCWTEPIHKIENSAATHFVCWHKARGKPKLVYKTGKYKPSSSMPIEDKSASIYYQKLKKTSRYRDASISGYYVCKTGCINEVPHYIFEFTLGE